MDVNLIVILILAAMLVYTLLLSFKQKSRLDTFDHKVEELESKIIAMQHDVSALCSSGLGVDERVDGTEKRVRSLIERLEELEDNDSSEHLQEFQNAIKLAQEGASVDEIIDKCHLTADEATLLLRLHQDQA